MQPGTLEPDLTMADMDPDKLARNLRVKAVGERLAAMALLLLLSPLEIAIAAAIALEALASDEPPRVLIDERRQSAGRVFSLLKFRVFRVEAWLEHLAREPGVSIKALERRPELLTRTGRVLKRCYLDELPQLVNIARGEMALVGPRPYFEGDWAREPRLDVPARRLLRAGLVGPYQAVKGRISGLDEVNRLDGEYLAHLRKASVPALLARDLAIVARSLGTLLRAQGL